MKLHTLESSEGSRKGRKIVGRGHGSGLGKTCGRGHKGQKSRSGGGKPARNFEGGQMPLERRLPKRGFTNVFKKEYEVLNLDTLVKLDLKGDITPETLAERGVIHPKRPLKILGRGQLDTPLNISAAKFSKTAMEKIEKAGGKAVVI